jgi:hypothetical protein
MTKFWTQIGIQKSYGKQLNDYYLVLLALNSTSEQDENEILNNLTYPPTHEASAEKKKEEKAEKY